MLLEEGLAVPVLAVASLIEVDLAAQDRMRGRHWLPRNGGWCRCNPIPDLRPVAGVLCHDFVACCGGYNGIEVMRKPWLRGQDLNL